MFEEVLYCFQASLTWRHPYVSEKYKNEIKCEQAHISHVATRTAFLSIMLNRFTQVA